MSKTQTRSALHFLGGSKTQTSCLPNPNITFAKPKRYVAAYKYICIYVPPPVRDIILRIRPRRDSCNAKFDDGLVPRPQTHSAVVRCAEHVVGMTATPIFNRPSSNLLFARRLEPHLLAHLLNAVWVNRGCGRGNRTCSVDPGS